MVVCLFLSLAQGYSTQSRHSLITDDALSVSCSDGKLFVASVPQAAPPCMWSAVSPHNLSQLQPACGDAPNGKPMQAAPCDVRDPVCATYGIQHASSWFTPHVYRLASYASALPLQRTWLLARLTAKNPTTGSAAEPCVTHDENDLEISAALLLPPPSAITGSDNAGDHSTATIICEGFDASVVEHYVSETLQSFKRVAQSLPAHRRFVVNMDQLTESAAQAGYIAFEAAFSRGLDAWSPAFSELVESTNATFVNRGGAVLVQTPPTPAGGFPIASPQYGEITNRIAAAAMSNYMGWATNIDSAFTPVSAEDVEGWQTVLRRRKLLPALLAADLSSVLNSLTLTEWETFIASCALSVVEQELEVESFIHLVATNGGPHGLSACLRSKLQAACGSLSRSLCTQNLTQFVDAAPFGVTGDGLAPVGANASCENNMPFFHMWSTSTFCLMPGGDAFDRGATVQAIDVGCVPVFFSGTGRGDLLRRAFSRTFFGTDDPDEWSVLLSEEALLGCAGSADDEVCPASCVPASEMGPRLLEALLEHLPRLQSMRKYLIDKLLLRSQALVPLAGDFVSRFVHAATTSVQGAEPGPGNNAGKPDTWAVASKGVLAARAANEPACYLRQRSDGQLVEPHTCLPGFLVVGPQKTGTSALYEYLSHHPQLELNPRKELLHWGPPHGPNAGHFDCNSTYSSSYLDAFVQVSAASGNMTGDFSATDIACVCCPAAIRKLAPNVKIIVLMRDPVKRAQSRYKEQLALSNASLHGDQTDPVIAAVKRDGLGCDAQCLKGTMTRHVHADLPNLDDCLREAPSVRRKSECAQSQQVLGWSLYDPMVNNWLEHFPLEQIMLVKSSALAAASNQGDADGLETSRAALHAIEDFLGVQHAEYSDALLSKQFNSDHGYGWDDATSGTASGGGVRCDEACEQASQLSAPVTNCLTEFYQAHVGVFDVAGRFYASSSNWCTGDACSFNAMVIPQRIGRYDATTCLQTAEPHHQRRAAWLHIPKAGTAFINTVSHWLDAHKWLPPYARLPDCSPGQIDACERLGLSYQDILKVFSVYYPPYYWAGPHRLAANMKEGTLDDFCYAVPGHPGEVVFPKVAPNSTDALVSSECLSRGHFPVTAGEFEEWRGDWMAIFRDSASRTYSQYQHNVQYVSATHNKTLDGFCKWTFGLHARAMTPTEYGTAHAGLVVKMLSGQQDGQTGFHNFCLTTLKDGRTQVLEDEPLKYPYSPPTPPTSPHVALAIERLDGFAFVGLEEEWALSVCLFHVMHGGECFAVEDESARAGHYSVDPAVFNNLTKVDPWDAALYSAARSRFYRDLYRYNVTNEVCQILCPDFAYKFDEPGSTPRPGSPPASNATSDDDSFLYEELWCHQRFDELVRDYWVEPIEVVFGVSPAEERLTPQQKYILGLTDDLTQCLSRGFELSASFNPVVDLVRPNIVVVGIGDSGTRGVHDMLQHLGLAMSEWTNAERDNMASHPATAATPALLHASNGQISREGFKQNIGAWNTAVWLEQMGSLHTRKVAAPAPGQPWGFKSPRQVYLLPVLQEAYSPPTAIGDPSTILVVARDPRDICTGSNGNQFGLYAPFLNVGVDKSQASWIVNSRLPAVECFNFWAKLWRQLLPSLGGTAVNATQQSSRLVVVRIEDLVGAPWNAPLPRPESDAHAGMMRRAALELLADAEGVPLPTLSEREAIIFCILNRIGLGYQTQANVDAEIKILEAHASSYGGGPDHVSRAVRTSAEHMVEQLTGIHDVMNALGYDPQRYGRTAAAPATEVITAQSCPSI